MHLWRKFLTERSISPISFFLSPPKNISGHLRSFSSDFASTSSTKSPTHPNQASNSRSLLPVEIGRFHALDRELRAKAQRKFEKYQDVVDLQKRAPAFSTDDWREFMNALIAIGIRSGRIFFASNQLQPMTDIISYLAAFSEQFDPNDYCNFIRLLLNFEYGFNGWNEQPVEIEKNICKWFMKNFDRLEPSAFFEILLVKTQWLEERFSLAIEPEEDVMKFLEHGVQLATQSSGISASLRMLHMIECYKTVIEGNKLTPFANRLIATLSRNVQPECQRDLSSSLKFIAGPQHREMKTKKMKKMIQTPDVFRHYVCGSKNAGIRAAPKATWKWLRESIEMTFDSDEFDHLRQLAAFAAVDAFKYKAVHFTADELGRFLISASKPFMTNPAVVLEPMRTDVASVPRTIALKLLLAAICRGLLECSDSRLRDLLSSSSTRFDHLYWDRFWNTLLEEAPKRLDLDDRRLVLTPLNDLNKAFHSGEMLRLHSRDRTIIRKPLDHSSRRYLLRCLTEPEPNKV